MGAKKKETLLSVLKEILLVMKAIATMFALTSRGPVAEKGGDQHYINLAGGWIKDAKTGLEWGPSSDKSMKWEEAKKFCVDQGGRLPNVNELLSLVDRTKSSPATTIPGMKSEWYWTCEEIACNSGRAWFVFFFYGDVGTYDKDGYGYVRPVRSGQ